MLPLPRSSLFHNPQSLSSKQSPPCLTKAEQGLARCGKARAHRWKDTSSDGGLGSLGATARNEAQQQHRRQRCLHRYVGMPRLVELPRCEETAAAAAEAGLQ
ncbi:hypothetical protein Esti_004899 [Eimeria stiedai]